MRESISAPANPQHLSRMAAKHDLHAAMLRTAAVHAATGEERDALLAKAAQHEQDAKRDRDLAGLNR